MNPTPRLITVLSFGLTLTLSAATTPEAKPIGSSVFKWESLVVKPNANGERRDVANNPTPTFVVFESHITTLDPGKASHAPHTHNQEELIFLKEGDVEVHINGKTTRAGAGSVFFFASNDSHNVTNVGTGRATYWVVNFATARTADLTKHNQAPTLLSGVFDWTKMKPVKTATGERRGVFEGSTVTLENIEMHVTTLNPGQTPHAAHRHPDEEIIIIKEGALEVSINGKTERANAGSVLLYASNDLHGMRNAADTPTTYYVIRAVTTATPKAQAAAAAAK
ncbi:MAG: cupin domain-containing protein [Opitutaceae bacterium]